MSRRLAMFVACLAVLVVGAAAPSPARANEGLAITSHTVYEVMPPEGRIAVSVDLRLTNVVPDTATERTYYTGVTVPVPGGATAMTATSGGASLAVRLTPVDELSAEADITFGRGVFSGETYPVSLRFVIADAGGVPDRETWVRSSFVAFPVWALGTSNAAPASVEVILPAGFKPSVADDDLEVEEGPDRTRLTWTTIRDPGSFFAYVVAEREVRRARHEVEVVFADRTASIVLRAWPDDPDWAERQADLLVRGLPLLEAEIGLAYPVRGALNVSEHAYRHLGDYGGWFIDDDDTIEMRFDADAFTTLHEAAHIWMNGSLTPERWLLEGFASYYAEVVGTALGEDLEVDVLTNAVAAHAFPLADWGRPMRESPEREAYGYAASLAAAHEIAAAAGADGLRQAWQAALDRRPAYAIHDDERRLRGDPRPDEWQRLLDLLENASGASLETVWRTWVLDDERATHLDERAAARREYASVVEAAGPWELPAAVRRAMEGWDFDRATSELEALAAVLARRDAIEAHAAELNLRSSDRLRLAVERDGAAAADGEAEAQERALAAIAASTDRLATEPSFIQAIGLSGEPDPAHELAAARSSYESGHNGEAHDRAVAAAASRSEAVDRGRTRIAAAGGGLLLADAAFLATLAFGRRRRHAPSVEG